MVSVSTRRTKGLEAIDRSITEEEKLGEERKPLESHRSIIKLKASQAREIISSWESVLGVVPVRMMRVEVT